MSGDDDYVEPDKEKERREVEWDLALSLYTELREWVSNVVAEHGVRFWAVIDSLSSIMHDEAMDATRAGKYDETPEE